MKVKMIVLSLLVGGMLALLCWPGLALADGPAICSTPNLPIPDAVDDTQPGVITDTLSVAQSGVLTDLNISIAANHDWVGDLSFTLTHLDTGNSVTLIDRPGTPPGEFGCNGDDIAATLDDEAAAPVEDVCNRLGPIAISGVFTPNNPLSLFDGENIAGTWQLTASDHAGLSTGKLGQWCLIPAPQADLALNKQVNQANPAENEVITYTVRLSNNGPDEATNVIISDTLPMSLTFVSADPSQGTYNAGTGLWEANSLSVGQSVTLTLAALVNGATLGQTIINTAEVGSAGQLDLFGANNADDAVIRVTNADLALTKTVSQPTPGENEVISYTVTVFNNGPDGATGVVVSDTLPFSLSLVAASVSQGNYDSSGEWSVGKLLAGRAATLTLTATVQAGAAGQTITNTALVSASEQNDADSSNNSASAPITVTNADLAVSKIVDNSGPKEGGPLLYTVTVTNNGPDDATGVVVSDTLPLSVTLTASSTSQGGYDSATGLWQVGDLTASASATLTLSATVQTGTIGQIITNTAAISASDQSDADLGNNSADAVVRVSSADLALSKTVDQAQPNENELIVYTVVMINQGPDNATGVVISETLPLSLTLVTSSTSQGSYDSSAGRWQAGSLVASETATLTLTALVNAGTAGQTLTNTAEVSQSDQSDPFTANNTASVPVTVTNADLAVSKSVDNPNPRENDLFSYTVTVSNSGPDEATGVVISETLPLSLSLVTSTASQGSYNSSLGAWEVGSLPAGQGAALTLTVAAQAGTAGQIITNTAQVGAAAQGDANGGNNSASITTTVVGADLSISKNSSEAVAAGSVFTYTITVTNSGPSAATGVVVSDTLPVELNFVSVEPGLPTCAEASGVISCTLGTLNNGAAISVTLAVTPTTVGTLTNTASVASNETDPIPADNSATAETIIGPAAPEAVPVYLPIIAKE
ncbi:MAG: DUF11 domain-containing protein [Anaerolineales bacterium]|nr:DUF11 domain-containing protein [Anaerolineales bacterium]